MADVMGAYFGGLKAAQQENAAQQETEARSLQQMVLKHQMDRNKIQDAWEDYDKRYQVSARALAAAQGQPAASLPSTTQTTQAPDLPSQNLAGMVNGMATSRLTGTMADPTASAPGPNGPTADASQPLPTPVAPPPAPVQPTITPAPLAQSPEVGTHPVTTSVRTPVPFPGFGDQPGYSVTPQSREELTAQAIALKRAEQPPVSTAPGAITSQIDPATGQLVPQVQNANLPPTASLDEKLLKAVTDGDMPQQRAILAVMGATARAKGGTLAEQYAAAVQNGDPQGAQTLLTAMTSVAKATKDPAMEAMALQMKALQISVERQTLANITPTADDQPVSKQSAAIAAYQLPPLTGRAAVQGAGKKTMDDALRENPGYDASQYAVRAPTRKAFTTGTQGQQINAINTAIGHIDQLDAVADRLQNGGFVPANAAWNTVRTMFGSDTVTNFDTLKDALAGEVSSVLSKGSATVSGIAEAKDKIKGASSPTQLAGYIKTLIPIMGSKLHALDYQYHQAMGAQDPFSALSPEAKAILTRRGFDPDNPHIAQGAGGTPNKGDTKPVTGKGYPPGAEQTFDGTNWIRTK